MKVAVVVAHYHAGTTAEYVVRALHNLSHLVELVSPLQLAARAHTFDLILCVDSGTALNLPALLTEEGQYQKLGFWFIDYRHNKNRLERIPNDQTLAKHIIAKGGWVFQAQYEDYLECAAWGSDRVAWIPLGADTEIWSNAVDSPKLYDVAFVGNVWDKTRQEILLLPHHAGLRCAYALNGKLWGKEAAAFMRQAKIAFNINSFFGEPFAYDINMRLFESLSCGVPLLTNRVPSLTLLPDLAAAPFLRTFSTKEEILPTLHTLLSDAPFLASGDAARAWVLQHARYDQRVAEIVSHLAAKT